ncbi:hypothetical protein BDW68DRAFT_170392, partial [Aspergillus falconensis]
QCWTVRWLRRASWAMASHTRWVAWLTGSTSSGSGVATTSSISWKWTPARYRAQRVIRSQGLASWRDSLSALRRTACCSSSAARALISAAICWWSAAGVGGSSGSGSQD